VLLAAGMEARQPQVPLDTLEAAIECKLGSLVSLVVAREWLHITVHGVPSGLTYHRQMVTMVDTPYGSQTLQEVPWDLGEVFEDEV
jgi:hypothetical protein